MDSIEKEYLRQLNGVKKETDKEIGKTFNTTIDLILLSTWLYILSGGQKPTKRFRFRNYPMAEKSINDVMGTFHKSVVTNITDGIKKGWEVGNYKNDKIVNEYFKTIKDEIPPKFKQRNLASLDSYISRSKGGMDISARVWKLTGNFKKEIEMHIGQGISNGETPYKIGMRIKQYLNNPLTAEKGVELLKQTSPGQGVYRSAKKNAMRLARNEVQMAYRESNWERWQQQDFIIGQYIRVSASHHIYDICDEVQGAYPKSFKFVGWHVSCTCICMPITAKDYNEDMADQQIKDLPKGFETWVEENSDRIEGMKNKPYFIRDNKKVVDSIIKNKSAA